MTITIIILVTGTTLSGWILSATLGRWLEARSDRKHQEWVASERARCEATWTK